MTSRKGGIHHRKEAKGIPRRRTKKKSQDNKGTESNQHREKNEGGFNRCLWEKNGTNRLFDVNYLEENCTVRL